jgi:hypothetical protein
MAYTHQRIEYIITATAGAARIVASATGEKANRWAPGHTPVTLRGVAIAPLVTTAIVTKAKFSIRLVTGGNGKASVSGDQIATLTMASGSNQGKWRYRKLNTYVKPGTELAFVVTTKATQAMGCRVVAYVEPMWDEPGNNTRMTLVTG